MSLPAPTPYDLVPYPSYTHVQTHPGQLATVATMFGMTPTPVERCRVLEVGCGDGSNLIPMACALPDSDFTGIDLAAQPIAQAQEMAAGLGLKNLRIVRDNITAIGPDWGRFDYIIAHGFYSWVPAEAREHLLAICRQNLAPQGVAFVSYNAYPGQHAARMLREMMLFHVRGFASPTERIHQAQALLRFLAEAHTGADEYSQLLRAEIEHQREREDNHLYHDDLAEINEPFYFTQFMDHAQRHGLQYLGEAGFFEALDWGFPPAVRQTLAQLGPNRILREQYSDFLKCRRFRQTLLCHQDVSLQLELRPEQVPAFLVSSSTRPATGQADLAPRVPVRFQTPKGLKAETDFALGKAALLLLGEIWPRPLPFDELLAQAHARLRDAGLPQDATPETRAVFCQFLLQTYGTGVLAFHCHAPACAARAGARPDAFPPARWRVQHGHDSAPTAFHHTVQLEDEIGRQLLLLLDGTRDRAALVDELVRFLKSKNALAQAGQDEAQARQRVADELEKNLAALARLGLLVA